MPIRILFTTLVLMPVAATAGTLTDGHWAPAKCGTEPEAVSLDLFSADAYNGSLLAVKIWQDRVNAYRSCLVSEATADNAAVVKAANESDRRIKAAFDRLNAQSTEAAQKFSHASALPPDAGRQTTAPANPYASQYGPPSPSHGN